MGENSMNNRPKITVVGSINMDLVIQTKKLPQKGETLLGKSFQQFPGGKGANQAVAAARLGAEVSFIGCVGNDEFGNSLLERLQKENINVDGIVKKTDTVTGIAQITVSENDNSIIVVPGANYEISLHLIDQNIDKLVNADIIITQLEIPMEIVSRVIDIAYENNTPVILNPAPAQELSSEMVKKVSYITPNETELAAIVSNITTNRTELEEFVNGGGGLPLTQSFETLLQAGVKNIIVTMGEHGAAYQGATEDGPSFRSGHKVDVVDTTGAGDTFNGALAVAIAQNNSLKDSVEFAIKSAALSVTKFGAQSGMPTYKEVATHFTL